MNTSITAVPFVVGLAVVTLAMIFVAIWVAHARLLRFLAATVAFVLVLTTAGAAVNAYYNYLPTVATLFGQRAEDQASSAQVGELVAASAKPTHGVVEKVSIPGLVSHFAARPAQVYLPPAWFRVPRPRLPVLELLHGTPGTPEDWTRAAGADVVADAWAATHDGWAPILLLVDENGSFTADTECANGVAGSAETYLAVDVPAWAVAKLGADPERVAWGIGGNSEGGYCAITLALRHLDRYSLFLDFSGLDHPTRRGGALHLFDGSRAALDAHTPRLILRHHHHWEPRLAGWFEVGSADGGTTRSMIRTAALSRADGIQTHLVLRRGGHHTWRVWRASFADALPWAATRLTAASGAPPQVLRIGPRQPHAHHRAAQRCTVRSLHRPAVGTHQRSDDRQPKPRPARASTACRVGTGEAVEHDRQQ